MPAENSSTTITRTIDILTCLAKGLDRIADICQELGYNKSTVHRLLKALESGGFVIRDPTNRHYYLSPLFVELATQPLTAHRTLTISAAPDMERLRTLSQETVVLHIPRGLSRICISEFESCQDIKYTAGVGKVAPIYVGSAGKLLLSEYSQRDIQVILKNLVMEPVGPNTITDKKKLLGELEKVRRDGYAISLGERLAHSASISVSVKNYICPVSLSILGPEDRFRPHLMETLPAMREAAENISRRLLDCQEQVRR